ncbi:uncharacterized protein LOC129584086 [Paramacrobiotus metropolitanus]|uniref:uncharacterized protein LOC129584086 n=1 Tax=Paramacrobiotus metropolitanus TaxID=2943436 RepID=UPI00244657B4|nr:uncharacterized protein LOC129584086 [Paramacrobiotus metropolitanus]
MWKTAIFRKICKSDLRSIYLQWSPLSSANSTISENSVDYLVRYCEDYSWDNEPKNCRASLTNRTEVTLRELRPATKYLVLVEQLPNRTGRHMSNGTPNNALSGSASFASKIKLDRDRAVSIETQKYAIRNVDCLKGRTNVTVETGDSFEGTISVQKSGSPQKHCSVKGIGAAQQMYYLIINHTDCNVEFHDNGTIMEAIVQIQEHPTLVLGTDQSFRISCNYQPAVIQIQTGMGMDAQHQVTRIGATHPADSTGRISSGEDSAPRVAFMPALNNITSASQLANTADRRSSNSNNSHTTSADPVPPLIKPLTIPSGQYDTPEKISQFYGDEPVKSVQGHRQETPALHPAVPVSEMAAAPARRTFPDSIKTSRPTKVNALIDPGIGVNNTFLPSKHTIIPLNTSLEETRLLGTSQKSFGAGRMPAVQIIIIAVAGTLTAVVLLSMIVWFIAFRNKPGCAVFPRKRVLRHLTDDERYA